MKFNIIETGRICSVIRSSGLGHHLSHFGISHQFTTHGVGQLHRFIQSDALRKRGAYINGTFIQLRKKLRSQESKKPQSENRHHRRESDSETATDMKPVEQQRSFFIDKTDDTVIPLTDITFQQHRRQDRNQCQSEDQSPQQCESQCICQRREHLSFHFLKREYRHQRCDNNQFGEEHRFRLIFGSAPDKPHFRHPVERRHSHLVRFSVQRHKNPFYHHHGAINDDAEIYRSHRKQIGRHSHRSKADKGKEQRQRNHDADNHCRPPIRHKN